MPRKKQQKKPPISRLHRHPNYFLLLGSFIFLGAIASFLLILTNVLMRQSQDIRDKASGGMLPDLVISENITSKKGYGLTEPIQIQVTVKNRGTAAVTKPFSVLIQAGRSEDSDYPNIGSGFSTSIPVTVPIAIGAEHKVVATIPAGQLGPGSYALSAVPDPATENKIAELIETDMAFSLNAFEVTTQPTSSAATPATATSTVTPATTNNMYFTSNNSLEIFKEGSNESIKVSSIMDGERYRVKHTARVQSEPKNFESTDARSIIAQFRANDSGFSTKNFALSQLERAQDGIDIVFETTFTGKTDNSFVTTIDASNAVTESSETDNTLTTTYSYQVQKITTTQTTYAGCNDACSSNRDCSAGLACNGGRCRNPSGPLSTTCQATTKTTVQKQAEKTVTTGGKGGVIASSPTSSGISGTQPTAKPTASPKNPLETPTPTISPTAAPSTPAASAATTVTPEPTQPTDLQGEAVVWFNQFLITLQGQLGLQQAINPLWVWLVVGGIALLIIVLLVLLLGRKHHSTLPVVPPPVTTKTEPTTPPPLVMTTASTTASPVAPTTPVSAKPTPATTQTMPSTSSMVSKLQSRGVIKPSPSTTQTPDSPTE